MRLADDVPPHWTSPALAGARHGFFGRAGGVSNGIYASLNAGTGSHDDAGAVAENRRRIAAAFGAGELIGVHQVHSATAVFVDAPWTSERPRADALVTTTPSLLLSVLTADCAPVLLADARAVVIGAAHAGWRGALSGVLEATVALMRARGATKVNAAIGPCIHQKSYEVGAEFRSTFLETAGDNARFFAPGVGEKFQFDLPGFCAARLDALGVGAEIIDADTYSASSDLFSHRRSVHAGEPDYGRNCSAIML